MDRILFENNNHKFILFSIENNEEKYLVSNQYMIIHRDKSCLIDPGGFGLFAGLLSKVLKYTPLEKIKKIILSHQDPDVCGGISVWAEITDAEIYIPHQWFRFISHYGIKKTDKVHGIPHEGQTLKLTSEYQLTIIPAHFLHSAGNISVYDPVSKILFSGDIGAGFISPSENKIFVEDFDSYISYIEKFHKDYMASNKALKKWLEKVKTLEIEIVAPQHGLLYKDENITKLFHYLDNLKCGVDLL